VWCNPAALPAREVCVSTFRVNYLYDELHSQTGDVLINRRRHRFAKYLLLCRLGFFSFSALTLLVGRQEGHPAYKNTEWWGAGVVICLERGAVLHKAQLMPLPQTISCSSKIQIGFTFLVPAYPGSPGKSAVKRVCVCVCVCVSVRVSIG